MPDFLLELLSEEIPARMQARADDDLKRLFCDGLTRARIGCDAVRTYVTPRRLALIANGLPERQPDITEERKGPRVGAPQGAIDGFLKASGLAALGDAEVRETEKGAFYFAVNVRRGRTTAEAIADVVIATIGALSWPKSMRWGDFQMRWVRPLHGVVAMLDGAHVPLNIVLRPGDGAAILASTTQTRGHRFLAPEPLSLAGPADYLARLEAAKVIADQARRRQMIEAGARAAATAQGLSLRDDPALLDEVTGLVEWPVVLTGRIDPQFMALPQEVLITAMRAHQKYFATLDTDGRMAPFFVVVANTETADGGKAVIAGNERVLRARLSDAKFFWDHDRKTPLASRVDKLKERVFHAKLGSDFQRTERLERLARDLAPYTKADPNLAARAARLCKADLTTGLVGEFPELQGVMGRYYALNDGEVPAVADAIAEHYAPQGPNDRCPSAPVSVTVALADKIDTLVGFFTINEKPTGSKDPFALRRACLGVIRLIVENGLRLRLLDVFDNAGALFTFAGASAVGKGLREGRDGALHDQRSLDLLTFFADRLKVHLREQGVRHDLIAAVLAAGGEDDLVRLLARVDALRDFLNTDDGANVLTAYRRASSIVRIEEQRDGVTYDGEVMPSLFSQQEETALFNGLVAARDEIASCVQGERFAAAMTCLARLRGPVDAFFDRVTVNCDEKASRANRLRLLSQIRSALGGVADFSLIEG